MACQGTRRRHPQLQRTHCRSCRCKTRAGAGKCAIKCTCGVRRHRAVDTSNSEGQAIKPVQPAASAQLSVGLLTSPIASTVAVSGSETPLAR